MLCAVSPVVLRMLRTSCWLGGTLPVAFPVDDLPPEAASCMLYVEPAAPVKTPDAQWLLLNRRPSYHAPRMTCLWGVCPACPAGGCALHAVCSGCFAGPST
jgi:hypothetical protein